MVDARTRQGEGEAALAEVRKVHETADRLANGDTPVEADQIRVLGGLVAKLAEQVERLATPVGPGVDPQAARHDRELELEEDRTPEEAPADPLDDRAD